MSARLSARAVIRARGLTMQFIKSGPDIPELLIQEHEEGRVVFFCGAGISYPAGLPGFKGLVDGIYDRLGTRRDAIEEQAYTKSQYDATIDLLERRVPGQRIAVRTALMEVLKPKFRRKGAADTHAALLQLAKGRDSSVRLVTTNFDRIFHRLMARAKPAIAAFPAPLLPVPKNSRWNGVVYLHGLLPEVPDESALNRLVLSSGDFGLAYLTERWAARFVSELFRNYVVCFVGYSINDPVLRYMMDALAADRMLGEATPQAYALADFQTGQEWQKKIEWEAKGVAPILYEVPAGTHDHSALHGTLRVWAETYRDGVRGRERIVVDYAQTRPIGSTRQDDFVGRMLWALSHDSGLPAKRFADHDPAPSLEWLESLSEERYRQPDLSRFGVTPRRKPDAKLEFSLTRRPSPYTHAPWMVLVNFGSGASQWDDVMVHLARWLIRHLDDPTLVWWLAKRGGQLHERFASLIESRLDELARMERDGKLEELDRIRASATKAIPGPFMCTVWRLLLAGCVKSPWREYDLFRWRDRFRRYGLTTSLRLELREMLAPRVLLRQPYRWGEDDGSTEPQRLKDLVDWEIVLATDHVQSTLNELTQTESWRAILPQLLTDVQQLLRDALDLMRELGEADNLSDRAHWDLPSISPHWQNRGYRDWVVLIEILRDAWVVTHQRDLGLAVRIVRDWLLQPYPTFTRLALFAAVHEGVATNGEWVRWLGADDGWWLWSVETQREAMRLLVLRGVQLPPEMQAELETSILSGPPLRMFRSDVEPDRWTQLVDHMVWLRLAKLLSGGVNLSKEAQVRLDALTATYPEWKLASNESDEFSHWMSGTGDPDFEDRRQHERVPRRRQELVAWLQKPPSTDPWRENDWNEVCRDKFPTAACALFVLAKADQWPVERWRDALQAWSNEKLLRRSWRYVAPVLQRMPDEQLRALAHAASWWLESTAKVFDLHEAVFLDLCQRLLAMPHEDGVATDEPVTRAINHPVGHVTQGLLHRWFRRQPEDRQRLPDDLKPTLTLLCNTQVDQYRHGRVLLAANVIALYRVDPDWALEHLIPLFRWCVSAIEARAAWEGFLWSPRLYRPLISTLKPDFLECANRYEALGAHGSQYAIILTFAAVDPGDTFTTDELVTATTALPQKGLLECAQALVRALEGAGDQRADYWRNRIRPYLNNIWPKAIDVITPAISANFARLCVAAGDAFPEAVRELANWLRAPDHPDFIVHQLHESKLSGRYPAEALSMLTSVISDDAQWLSNDLVLCLDDIIAARPDLQDDNRHRRLRVLSERRGIG